MCGVYLLRDINGKVRVLLCCFKVLELKGVECRMKICVCMVLFLILIVLLCFVDVVD